MSRRDFLKRLAGGAALLATGGLGGEMVRRELKEKDYNEKLAVIEKNIHSLINSFTITNKEINKKNNYTERTISEKELVRDFFLEKNGGIDAIKNSLHETLIPLVQLSKDFDVDKDFIAITKLLYKALDTVDLQGTLLDFMLKNCPDQEEKFRNDIFIDKEISSTYFHTKAEDYWPEKIMHFEIDQRIGQWASYPNEDIRLAINESYIRDIGWSDEKKLRTFRMIMANEDVKHILQNSDCTLAEVFSIIKAAIIEYPDLDKKQYSKVIKELLTKREQFKSKEIIGPHTDEVIIFNYGNTVLNSPDNPTSTNFDGSFLKKLSDELVEDASKVTLVHERAKNTDQSIKKTLSSMIEHSKGATTLLFNTHGTSTNELLIDEGRETLKTFTIANPLMMRVINSAIDGKNYKDELSDVTIFLASCHSYNFAKELERAFRSEFNFLKKTYQDLLRHVEISYDEINLPTVITMANKGSVTFSSACIGELKKHRKSINRQGTLDGAFLLQSMQPDVYGTSDITFFNGDKGNLEEIGMTPVTTHTKAS